MAEDKFVSSRTQSELWDECCGFLTLSLDQYMTIQNRLLSEQMSIWVKSPLGQKITNGKSPQTIDEFRRAVPLTTYEDYADVLLSQREEMLPEKPAVWIETTWEGGKHPIKSAPYTQAMLDTFHRNARSLIIFSTATDWNTYTVGKNVLSGLAPLPYLTGLMGQILDEEYGFNMFPPRETTLSMSFSERSKLGIKMGLSEGIDYFFGLGSISYHLSKQIGKSSGSSKKNVSPKVLLRMLKAKAKAKKEGREVYPKDIFDLKGFVCAGTDNACYKDDLEKLWGVRPMEIFAGTECSLVGTETWNRKDLYFYPDVCFYEFLPLECVRRTDKHMPTLTMDQVEPGGIYELVVTVFKGGAFARYRMGDVYRCVGIGDERDHSSLPRFRYIDRVPTIIDIAGFTRITENSINEVVALSRLPIKQWCAAKEFDAQTRHPFLHLYVEMEAEEVLDIALSEEVLRRHLEVYFSYQDNDYDNLKKILEMEPLRITFVQSGTFEQYEAYTGAPIETMNPPRREILSLLAHHSGGQVWSV
ncbi:MAG: GH3 auxin-responsive promoter family protein [Anaerotardibacter sp.]